MKQKKKKSNAHWICVDRTKCSFINDGIFKYILINYEPNYVQLKRFYFHYLAFYTHYHVKQRSLSFSWYVCGYRHRSNIVLLIMWLWKQKQAKIEKFQTNKQCQRGKKIVSIIYKFIIEWKFDCCKLNIEQIVYGINGIPCVGSSPI